MYLCLWRFILTIEILSNMETKLCLVLHVDHKPLIKSVKKCKRYSAFYPETPQLHHSLAFVYSPAFTSPRWQRVGRSQQRSEAVNVFFRLDSTLLSLHRVQVLRQ